MTLNLEQINDFYDAQFREWTELKPRYDALMQAERRNVGVGDMTVALQFNPARIKSTGAAVDTSSLARRPCFLCKANRPREQRSLGILDSWHWLINPYPIFPVHVTIASKAHEPQEEIPLDMVAAAEAAPELAFFYNGARAGASAPDHLHFQATLKEELPLIAIAEKYHQGGRSSAMDSTDFPVDLPLCFRSITVVPDAEGMQLLSLLPTMYGFDAVTGAPDPGMVNVIVWIDDSRTLRAIVIPRKRHRPACYTSAADGEGCMVSPGAVDMAGVLILPRKSDFDTLDAERIASIYAECGLTKEEFKVWKPLDGIMGR